MPLQTTVCERCDQSADNLVQTTDGQRICLACRDYCYLQCGTCSGWHHEEDRCANGCPCECGDCGYCDDAGTSFDGLVRPYDYRPRPVFHGTGPLFLGPEIEVEIGDGDPYRCAEIASNGLGKLGYLKHDDSLTCGFEMVTHPMSYDWALEHFPWDLLGRLRASGCITSEATGIHVHLSKAGFSSDAHKYRWMKFIYRNEPQVLRVARRHAPGWAAFRDEDRRAVKRYVKDNYYGDKYRAINTNNLHTFELRIFAGSLDPQVIKAAFAFSAASVEYTRTLDFAAVAAGGWTWPAFTDWLDDQPRYTPLAGQLEALACAC
ncbi:hypothetical protein BJY16_007391 [Actinoplanes octamycinicus]|uniref:Amidoligase enzyme n=1 Tax=Actinoplanes octamycinicus TaxID=135948 RepID=A0A7W7H5C8_9ACTN|nr:hypothetical protein [Actinoplanes octamycinicus]MBB4743932.1 hypothetical protein [Actinoplanes octamycinicus]GIE58558.1 hypothetical protein Aoc01nite_39600 [Actinoplanes octamycinicus]